MRDEYLANHIWQRPWDNHTTESSLAVSMANGIAKLENLTDLHVDDMLANVSYNSTEEGSSDDQCVTFRIAFYFGIIGILCVIGLVGNTVSMFVLQKDRSQTVASFLLQALAIADNSVLLTSVFVLGFCYGLLPHVADYQTTLAVIAYTIKYIQPFGYISHTMTIWCTVLLALNRYVAICRPFQAPSFCTVTKARIQVAVVYLFAFIFNSVRFFQVTVIHENATLTYAQSTAIGEDKLFGVVYTNGMYTVLCVLLPLTFLVVLNGKLIMEISRMKARRASVPVGSQPPYREESITLVMIIIIVTVVICHLPDRLLHIFQYVIRYEDRGCGTAMYFLYALTNLLIILNSSINFFIYYVCRRRFRRILRSTLFCFDNNKHYRISSTMLDDQSGVPNGALLTQKESLRKSSSGNLLKLTDR